MFLLGICMLFVLSCSESEDRVVIPPSSLPSAGNVETKDSVYLFPVFKDGKWGYVDSVGRVVISPRFEEARTFQSRAAVVHYQDGFGMIDAQGKFLVESKYLSLEALSEGRALASDGGLFGFLDRTGKWIIEPLFEKATTFQSGVAVVSLEGKFGVIDRDGQWLVPAEFESLIRLEELPGYYKVGLGGRFGVAHDADLTIACAFREVEIIGHCLMAESDGTHTIYDTLDNALCDIPVDREVELDEEYGLFTITGPEDTELYDLNGKKRFGPVEFIDQFIDGLARVEDNGKVGFINAQGKIVVPMRFIDAFNCGQGRVAAWDAETSFVLLMDETGKLISNIGFDHIGAFRDGLAPVSLDGKSGYIDTQGKLIIPLDYATTERFENGLGVVSNKGLFGAVDPLGKVIVPLEYDFLSNFSDGEAEYKRGNQYGLINLTGQDLLTTSQPSPSSLTEGVWLSYSNRKVGALNRAGDLILKHEYDQIKSLGSLLIAEKAGRWGIYHAADGREIVAPECASVGDLSKGVVPFWIHGSEGQPGYVSAGGRLIWYPDQSAPAS